MYIYMYIYAYVYIVSISCILCQYTCPTLGVVYISPIYAARWGFIHGGSCEKNAASSQLTVTEESTSPHSFHASVFWQASSAGSSCTTLSQIVGKYRELCELHTATLQIRNPETAYSEYIIWNINFYLSANLNQLDCNYWEMLWCNIRQVKPLLPGKGRSLKRRLRRCLNLTWEGSSTACIAHIIFWRPHWQIKTFPLCGNISAARR